MTDTNGMDRALKASITEPLTRPAISTIVSGTGSVIRYTFYLFGAIVFGCIALTALLVWNSRTVILNEMPAFHLASGHLQRLSAATEVIASGTYGRAEVRQYGQLYDRDVDLTIALVTPKSGTPLNREFSQQLRDIRPMRTARVNFGTIFYDLETRFGPVRAAELRVDSDGQWKQCLGFLSRLETRAVYFTGWYCDQSGVKPSPDRLACMLDKLTLDKDLASKDATAFMRERMQRAPNCSATPVSQTSDTRSRSGISSPQRWSTPQAQQRRY
jgi:hypothetical protein